MRILGKGMILSVVLLFVVSSIIGYAASEAQPWMRGRDLLKFGGTLNLAVQFEPISLDTLRASWTVAEFVYSDDPPYAIGPHGELVPAGWLESVEHSPDGLVWTFHIKPGVTFHDGVPLDAEAFAWLMRKRIEDPAIYSETLCNVPDVDHIVVVDEYTVQIQQVGQPWPELAQNLSQHGYLGAMSTPRAVERYGETYGYEMAYGNGPFKVVEWLKGDHVSMVRNEDYWWTPSWAAKYAGLKEGEEYHPGPPYLEKLIFSYVPEPSTRVELLKTGEVDGIMDVPLSRIEEIEKIPHVKVMSVPSYYIEAIEYNTTKSPLNNETVRKALNYAINREAMVEAIYFGYAEPAYSPYTSTFFETPNTQLLYKYDLDKAKTLLAEDGWKDTDGDGVLDKNGQPLHFELWSVTEAAHRKIAVMAQAMWRELGVDVTVQQFDRATLIDKVGAGEHDAVAFEHGYAGKGDMYNWWFSPDYMWYPQMTGFDTPEFRALIKKSYEVTTMEDVDKINDAIVNYYYEHAALCALLHPDSLLAIRDNFMNVFPMGKGSADWTPYLYDVYRQDVYEANKAAAEK